MKNRIIPSCVLLFLVLSYDAHAQTTKPTSAYTIALATDRPDAFYRKGETVTFTLKLSLKGEPVGGAKLKWTLSKDGVDPRSEEAKTSADGTAVISGKLDEPGFLQCRADITPPGEKLITVRAAAAIDATQISPSMPPPDDFDSFWQEQRATLSAVPMNVRLTPVKSPVAGVECFDVQADCVGGAPMSGYLVRPINAQPATLPAIVLCHGAGVASSRLSIAANWAKEGMMALDFNAHGLPNGQPREFYAELYKEKLERYYLQGRESRESMFFHGLFMRLMRAMDVLTAQPEWDGNRLIAVGRSQGGAQAIAAAGLEPRVTFLCAEIPALCDHTGVVVGRINGWPKLVESENGEAHPAKLEAARYYDCVNFASRTKAGAFFTVGFIDLSCPPTGVYAAYNQIKGKKDILTMPLIGHRSTSEADAAVRDAVRKYLDESGARQSATAK